MAARRRDILAGGIISVTASLPQAGGPSAVLAQNVAVGGGPHDNVAIVNSRQDAEAASWPPSQQFVETRGYAVPGDSGAALWRRTDAEPRHPGKFRDGAGSWWELAGAEVTPQMFGASGRADDVLPFEAALTYIEATGRTLRIPAGSTVRLDTGLDFVLTSGSIVADPGAILDMHRGGYLRLGPGVERIADLSSDILEGGAELTFQRAHGLKPGDVLAVWNPRAYSQGPHRPYYQAGDMFRVGEVVSPVKIQIYGCSQESYAAADMRVYRLKGGSFSLRDVEIRPGDATQAIALDGLVGVRLDGVRAPAGAGNTVIDIYRCYDVQVRDPRISSSEGDAYPVSVSNSQKVLIDAMTGCYSSRHCLALGGRPGEGAVPTADVLVRGARGDNLATTAVPAADIHGGCKRVTYDSCVVHGAGVAGVDVTYRNCVIIGRPAANASNSGLAIYGGEVVGGLVVLEGCHIRAWNDSAEFGILHLDISRITRKLNLVLRNVIFENRSSESRASVAMVLLVGDSSPAAVAVTVSVDGFDYIGEGLAGLMIVRGRNDVSRRLQISLRNLDLPTATPLYLVNDAANYNVGFMGPGPIKGVKLLDDADVDLDPRRHAEVCVFEKAVTEKRTVRLDTSAAAPGDMFTIVRRDAGSGSLRVDELTDLAPGGWCTVAYSGPPTAGSFILIAQGVVRVAGPASAS